jgi:hypothetical protein
MPYKVKKLPNGQWGKFKKENGKLKLVSHHDSEEKANASVQAYYANKNESINEERGIEYKKIRGAHGETNSITIQPVTDVEFTEIDNLLEQNQELWKNTSLSWSEKTNEMWFEFKLKKEVQEFLKIVKQVITDKLKKVEFSKLAENKIGVKQMNKKEKLDKIIESAVEKRLNQKNLLLERQLEEEDKEPVKKYSAEEKKAFMNAVSSIDSYFNGGQVGFENLDLKAIVEDLKIVSEMAANFMREEAEKEDTWFDSITVKKNIKSLQTAIQVFEKSIKELSALRHRSTNAFEEIGTILSKYFTID